jgi:ribosomal-protein-alanine N-acetyltransferase
LPITAAKILNMEFEILTTERLRLRKITPEVYRYIFENYTAEEITGFLGITSVEFDAEKEKFEKGLTTFNRSFTYFQLINKASDTIIGWCGYHTWYLNHNRAEIGYGLFHDDYKGKGIMTEAIKPIIDYGFNKMNLHRIEAFIGPNNQASQKLVKKLNFTPEGLLREHFCKDNVMEDSIVFSLLKKEHKILS